MQKRQRKRKPIERKMKLLEKWAEADTADTAEADTGPRLTSGLRNLTRLKQIQNYFVLFQLTDQHHEQNVPFQIKKCHTLKTIIIQT